jgi:hypothetical protein
MPFSKKTNISIDTEQKTVYHVRANKHKKRPHFGGPGFVLSVSTWQSIY